MDVIAMSGTESVKRETRIESRIAKKRTGAAKYMRVGTAEHTIASSSSIYLARYQEQRAICKDIAASCTGTKFPS